MDHMSIGRPFTEKEVGTVTFGRLRQTKVGRSGVMWK